MPKLDLSAAVRIKAASGELQALKGQGFSWVKPAAPNPNTMPDVASMVEWWDASTAAFTFDGADPNKISAWPTAMTTGGSTLLQPTLASMPDIATATINGVPVPYFDNADDWMDLGAGVIDPRFVSFTYRAGNLATWKGTLQSLDSDFATAQADNTTGLALREIYLDQTDGRVGIVFNGADQISGPDQTTPNLSYTGQTTSIHAFMVCDLELPSESSDAAFGNYFGAQGFSIMRNRFGNYCGGSVAEFIVCDARLSLADRQQMRTYLAAKWGLTLTANQ